MWFLLLPMLVQAPLPTSAQFENNLEQAEADRSNPENVIQALRSPDARIQRLALRAFSRYHPSIHKSYNVHDIILPFTKVANVAVRQEAANALGQLNVAADYEALLRQESNGDVRAVLFESVGRVTPAPEYSERVLASGLADASSAARLGAARGLESRVRLNGRAVRPSPETLVSVRQAFRANTGQTIRELLLLVMNAAGDKDSATFAAALRDTSAGVRRLAVIGTKQWVNDPSPMVRYEALRATNSCERALQLSSDASETVQLAAIDMLGTQTCDARPLQRFVRTGGTWRVRAHALVALAKTSPDSARRLLPSFASDTSWHLRVYAATAARVLGDSATLATLARDAQPNVAVEAMTTAADAIHALASSHSGLLLAAANKLKGAPELPGAVPQVMAAVQRLAQGSRATTTDARVALIERLGEAGTGREANLLSGAMAGLEADVCLPAMALKSGMYRRSDIRGASMEESCGSTTHFPAPPLAQVARLRGATARITMKGLGVIALELLTDEAPLTVNTFAELAERGAYNGLTFHRIVPNFVIQGGSPGADEYDGLTDRFMRDEVGRTSHLRGTLGISTRGVDTGDGQIFVNLVDNFRLDHAYTVFARITSGMDVVDRVQEGDVIERVTIVRKP